MEEKLKKIIADTLKMDRNLITDQTTAEDVGSWDSINHIMLVSEIEKNFNINLNLEEVTDMESVEKIKEVLRKRGLSIE